MKVKMATMKVKMASPFLALDGGRATTTAAITWGEPTDNIEPS